MTGLILGACMATFGWFVSGCLEFTILVDFLTKLFN